MTRHARGEALWTTRSVSSRAPATPATCQPGRQLCALRVIQSAWPPWPEDMPNEREGSPPKTRLALVTYLLGRMSPIASPTRCVSSRAPDHLGQKTCRMSAKDLLSDSAAFEEGMSSLGRLRRRSFALITEDTGRRGLGALDDTQRAGSQALGMTRGAWGHSAGDARRSGWHARRDESRNHEYSPVRPAGSNARCLPINSARLNGCSTFVIRPSSFVRTHATPPPMAVATSHSCLDRRRGWR